VSFTSIHASIVLLITNLHGPIWTVSNSISIVACVSVTMGTYSPSSCLETALVYLLTSRSLHSNGSTLCDCARHESTPPEIELIRMIMT
jgi:hypothetical protein